MNEITIYNTLSPAEKTELQTIAEEIHFLSKKTAEITFRIGEGLARARDIFRHKDGGFQEWLETEFNESRRNAYNYINFYEKFKDNSSVHGHAHLEGLSQRKLFLLTPPSTPESAIEEVIERKEAGENITEASIKEIAEAHKEIERLKKELADKDEFFTAQHNEPTTYPLIPQIQELLDRQKIMPAKAKILQTMSEEGQGVWFTEYLQKFSAENQLTEQKAKVKALESQPQPKAEVIEKIIEKIPEDYEKLKKSVTEKTKIENRLKETESKLGSVSEKKTELQKEVDKLKAQLEVDTPTNIDNARALKMEREVKNLNWLFPDIKAEAKLAGGEMHETKKVIIEIIKLWSSLLQELDGQEIIELKR